jgi:Predicted glycosyltransferases
MEKLLTIAIPTYNRRHQLIRLLKSIETQDCLNQCNIVISDNCSNYSVSDAISEEFSDSFIHLISIYNRFVNTGGNFNISSLFTFSETKLLWIVGDDDELLPGAIKKVIDYHNNYPDIPFFKFAMPASFSLSEDIKLSCVNDLVKCHKKGYLIGSILFVSNNVYNVELIKPFLSDCLYFEYCSIPHILPMIHCLVDSDYDVLLCKDYIVKYNSPDGDHWNRIKVVTSLSTFLDIDWGKHSEIKKSFRVISEYFGFGVFLMDCMNIPDKSYRNYVYWKGINTVFNRKKNIFEWFALLCYKLELWFHIKFLTGLYNYLLNYQSDLQKKFREKAQKNEIARMLFYWLKRHSPILK